MTRSDAWAEKYSALLRGYIELMGGDGISVVKRMNAERLATLAVEQSRLTDGFASSGHGASSADLDRCLKIGSNISELMQSTGLGQQQTAADQNGGDALIKLTTLFDNIVRANAEDEAAGIFHDAHGVITDPARLALEQRIYALEQQRDNSYTVGGQSSVVVGEC